MYALSAMTRATVSSGAGPCERRLYCRRTMAARVQAGSDREASMRGAAAATGIAKDQVTAASRAFIGVSVALPQAAGHEFVPNGILTGANRINAAAGLLLSAAECRYTRYVERPNRLRNDVLLYASLWTTFGLLD